MSDGNFGCGSGPGKPDVPAGAIKRLLAQGPEGTGLAVPGMPAGSTGMEAEDMQPDTYDVILFGKDGRSTFAWTRGGEPA